MSTQNSNKQSSHEMIHIESEHIDSAPIVGGPPIPDFQRLQVTGCTENDINLYNQIQQAVECATNSGPLSQAVILAETAKKPPVSCMIDLITGEYSDCDVEIPNDKRKAAYDAFTEVTGFKPYNFNKIINDFNEREKKILNFGAFYMFFPIFLLSIIAIWLMVGFGWLNWVIGLFLTVISFVVLYGFSVIYRVQVQNSLTSFTDESQQLQQESNFEDSIAYWPQGLFAVACAVTATGGTGWTCNESYNCPPCFPTPTSKLRSTSKNCNAKINQKMTRKRRFRLDK